MRSHKTWLASKYRITNNNKNIEQIDSKPCIILSTLHTVTRLMLTLLLRGWYYCYLHFTDEESEAKSSRNLTRHIASKCWHQDSNSAALAPEFMFITVMLYYILELMSIFRLHQKLSTMYIIKITIWRQAEQETMDLMIYYYWLGSRVQMYSMEKQGLSFSLDEFVIVGKCEVT